MRRLIADHEFRRRATGTKEIREVFAFDHGEPVGRVQRLGANLNHLGESQAFAGSATNLTA